MTKPNRRGNQRNNQPQPTSIIAQKTTVYKGQLPPPDMLQQFEQIQPGFTDRLLTMVEDESAFKREQDRRMLAGFKLSTILGIVFAFLAVIIVSAVAVYAIYSGFGTAGASIMATCVVGVIIAFIQRRRIAKNENGNG